MDDFSNIRILSLTGKKDERVAWSEKFLARSRRSGIKNLLLGKIEIRKTGEEINEKAEDGNK